MIQKEILAAGLTFMATLTLQANHREHPNVIFLLVDDMGYGDMSCHGNPVFVTEHLDRLHDQSVRFTQFHAAPMSTPTRGQLMTGCEALRNGASWVGSAATHLRTELPVLPEVLHEAGYHTAIFGKWHLGDNYPLRPQDRGFDYTLSYPQQEIGTVNDYWYNDYFDDVLIENGVRKQFKGFCTDVWFQEATKWIDNQKDKEEPFFCYIPTNVTHGPFFAPKGYRDQVDKTNPELSDYHRNYVATMLNLDDNVGKFMKYLDDSGLSENTILIFMTDNGATGGCGMWNAGMRGAKANLWEGGHRVPFFVRVPGIKPKDVTGLSQAEDVFPTIIDLCGIKVPENCHFDGISLKKSILTRKQLPDRILVNQFQRRMEIKKYDACIMWGPWRLLNAFDAVAGDSPARMKLLKQRKKKYEIHFELYNLDQDPHQDVNVYDQYPEVVAKMKAYYDEWWERIEREMFVRGQIRIGNAAENPMTLTAPGWIDTYVTQKRDLLSGRSVTGHWSTYAEKTGTYRFRLYRWPAETGAPMRCGMNMYYTDPTVLGEFTAGKALDIRTATLEVNGIKQEAPVKDGELFAEFVLELQKGETMIKADFLDKNRNLLCGAYFVEVLYQE